MQQVKDVAKNGTLVVFVQYGVFLRVLLDLPLLNVEKEGVLWDPTESTPSTFLM
jgi:hypothetical protein